MFTVQTRLDHGWEAFWPREISCLVFCRWPLPSRSTLGRFISHIHIIPGISGLPVMLGFLRAALPSIEPLKRNTVIMFDEISVDSRLEYDQTHDQIRGPCKQALIVMVCPIDISA